MNTQELKDTTIMWYSLGFWGTFVIASLIVGMITPDLFTPVMTGVAISMLLGLGVYLSTLNDNDGRYSHKVMKSYQHTHLNDREYAENAFTPNYIFTYSRA